jgi:LysM repeat protein
MSLYVHHDATPAGPTPGALNWIIDSYNSGSPSAQLWLDTSGVWHFCGAGVASHAGVVRGGLTNRNSVGVETDHTVNELYPAPMMSSLLKGCAVACKVEKRQADFITFHKIEASPRGRKQDPWLTQASNTQANWDKELADFRAKVQILISTGGNIDIPTGPNIPSEGDWFDMATEADLERVVDKKLQQYAAHYGRESVKALINQQTNATGQPDYYPYGDTAKTQIADTVWNKGIKSSVDGQTYSAAGYLASSDWRIQDIQSRMSTLSRAELNEVARWIVAELDGDASTTTTATYTVKSGDTFTSIATAHGISVDQLKELNPKVTDINNINPGDVLNVPKA